MDNFTELNNVFNLTVKIAFYSCAVYVLILSEIDHYKDKKNQSAHKKNQSFHKKISLLIKKISLLTKKNQSSQKKVYFLETKLSLEKEVGEKFPNAEQIEKLANNGNALAQLAMGIMHSLRKPKSPGYRANKWFNKTTEYFEKAATNGLVDAQFYLGLMFYKHAPNRNGVKSAITWFQLAAKQGHILSHLYLAQIYQEDNGEENDIKNTKQAEKWLRRLAKKENPEAQYLLARLLINSNQHHIEAQNLLKASANQGNKDAAHYLGTLHIEGIHVPVNCEEAAKWFDLADLLNHKFDLFSLYRSHKISKILEDILMIDTLNRKPVWAHLKFCKKIYNLLVREKELGANTLDATRRVNIDELEQLAKKGDAHAQFILGIRYSLGVNIAKDRHTRTDCFEKATHYLLKAAKQGHLDAHFNLGMIYYKWYSIFDNEDHIKEAITWLDIAVERGHILAALFLAHIYEWCDFEYFEEKFFFSEWFNDKYYDDKVTKICLSLANKGHSEALFMLATHFLGHFSNEKKSLSLLHKKSLSLLEAAAQHGHINAAYKLGEKYLYAKLFGKKKSDPMDFLEAVRWYQLASTLGCSHAHHILKKILL